MSTLIIAPFVKDENGNVIESKRSHYYCIKCTTTGEIDEVNDIAEAKRIGWKKDRNHNWICPKHKGEQK